MIDLSASLGDHFQLVEFVASDTAHRMGIDNSPLDEAIQALQTLVSEVLEPLHRSPRVKLVHILSGFRCKQLNDEVGGERKSQHLLGEAADIIVPGFTPDGLQALIRSLGLPFDQCIAEPTWVHISHRRFGPQRWQCLKATRGLGGAMHYEEV